MAARERQAAVQADAIVAALDRVSDDALDDVMRDLGRALLVSARGHRYVLVAVFVGVRPRRCADAARDPSRLPAFREREARPHNPQKAPETARA